MTTKYVPTSYPLNFTMILPMLVTHMHIACFASQSCGWLVVCCLSLLCRRQPPSCDTHICLVDVSFPHRWQPQCSWQHNTWHGLQNLRINLAETDICAVVCTHMVLVEPLLLVGTSCRLMCHLYWFLCWLRHGSNTVWLTLLRFESREDPCHHSTLVLHYNYHGHCK